MASTSYRLFRQAPRSGSGSLYTSAPLRPYNSGNGLTSYTSSSGGVLGGSSPGPFSSNAVNAISNPAVASATIKSPAQADRIGAGYQAYDRNAAADNTSLTDFVKSYVGSNPAAKEYTDQESNAIGGFYDGGVQGNLNRLADSSLAASNLAAQRALGQAGRASAAYRMVNGNSSYADRQLSDQFSNIAIANAIRDAAQRRADYGTVLTGQQGNLGVRGKLMDNYLNRLLVPGQASSDLLTRQLGTLGTLGNLDYANTSYGAPTVAANSGYQPPSFNPAVANALSANSRFWAAHPGSPELDYVLPGTTGYGPLAAPAPPFVPTYDSYGRPQAQPRSPLTNVTYPTPVQNGAVVHEQYDPNGYPIYANSRILN